MRSRLQLVIVIAATPLAHPDRNTDRDTDRDTETQTQTQTHVTSDLLPGKEKAPG